MNACYAGGILYIIFGLIPVTLGLAGRILTPDSLERAILPALAHSFLEPIPSVIFTVVLASAVLSTIDSAILSPASVLSQNVLGYVEPRLLLSSDVDADRGRDRDDCEPRLRLCR